MSLDPASLRQRIIELGAMLRGFGLGVGVDAQSLALRALAEVGLADPEEIRLALRAAYAHSRPAQSIFDDVYPRWLRGEDARPTPAPAQGEGDGAGHGSTALRAARGSLRRLGGEGENDGRQARAAAYSPHAASGGVASLADGQRGMQEALRDAGRFLAAIRGGQGRRREAGRRGAIDLRQSLRAARATSGEIMVLRRSRRKPRPPRVVLLLDFSRSMLGEGEGAWRLAKALTRRSPRTEVFAFSTELRRITRAVRQGQRRDLDVGLAYGGGTRIGHAIRSFLDAYGDRLLDASTAVVIVSDGLDTGSLDVLAEGMAALRRRAQRIYWLSPLAGTAGFQPIQGGLKTSLPWCDAFGDALDPSALTKLVHPGWQGRRPA